MKFLVLAADWLAAKALKWSNADAALTVALHADLVEVYADTRDAPRAVFHLLLAAGHLVAGFLP